MIFKLFGIVSLFFALLCHAPAWAGTVTALDSGLAALKAENYEKAIDLLLPLAVEGNAEAQYQIGFMHMKGQKFQKDPCIAIIWIEKAARQSHPKAALMMGFKFYFGSGVKENLELAYRWASYAHKLGHVEGETYMYIYGYDLPQDKRDAIDRDMESWDPDQLPPTEYFLYDSGSILPKTHYKTHSERTRVMGCRYNREAGRK